MQVQIEDARSAATEQGAIHVKVKGVSEVLFNQLFVAGCDSVLEGEIEEGFSGTFVKSPMVLALLERLKGEMFPQEAFHLLMVLDMHWD